MNTNVKFTLYTRPTDVGIQLKTSHVFVASSDKHNWNCFGHGAESIGDGSTQPVITGGASSKWATAIYGPESEGDQGSKAAAGLWLNYDGVCHTAANRVLILAGDTIDTRGTDGDILAVMMYGKLGFNIEKYKNIVKSTGEALAQSDPTEVTKDDIDAVLRRIDLVSSANFELDMLHTDAQEQIDTIFPGTKLPPVSDVQRTAFCPIYADYQNDRAATFVATAMTVKEGDQIAFGQLRKNLAGPWKTFCDKLVKAIGPDGFKDIFGVTPEQTQSVFA